MGLGQAAGDALIGSNKERPVWTLINVLSRSARTVGVPPRAGKAYPHVICTVFTPFPVRVTEVFVFLVHPSDNFKTVSTFFPEWLLQR